MGQVEIQIFLICEYEARPPRDYRGDSVAASCGCRSDHEVIQS